MTSIGIIQATVSSTVSTTGTTFAEVVESSALTNGTVYYVVCHAIVEGNSSSLPFEWRLVDRTNSDAVLSNSTVTREPTQSGTPQSYYFVGKFVNSQFSLNVLFDVNRTLFPNSLKIINFLLDTFFVLGYNVL